LNEKNRKKREKRVFFQNCAKKGSISGMLAIPGFEKSETVP
jgi:hypothetical protein